MKKFSAYISETGQYEDVFLVEDVKNGLNSVQQYVAYVGDIGSHHDVIKVSDFFKATMLESTNVSVIPHRRKK